jgi:NTP pyrophosphatase (non-canonical NTP hydrolase)
MKSLAVMTEEVYENTVAKGWYETSRTFGDDVALGHSEWSEMLEAYRDYGMEDASFQACASKGDHTSDEDHICKPEGIGSEAADVLIRLMDTCRRYDINLEFEYERKMAFNRTRPHRHGGRAL